MKNKNPNKTTKDQSEESDQFSFVWFFGCIFVSYLCIDGILFVHPEAGGIVGYPSSVGRLIFGIIFMFASNYIWGVLFKSDKIILMINAVLWYVILITTTFSAVLVATTGFYYAFDVTKMKFSYTGMELYMEYSLLIICPILLLVTFYFHLDYLRYKRIQNKGFSDWFDEKFGKDDEDK